MQLSDVDTRRLNPTVKEGLGNQFSVLIGLALLGFTALAFAALASWSVTDPSLSNANGEEIANTIGYPGAVFADFIMQFFGLASAIALIPPALWGWAKLLQRKTPAMKNRVMLWPLAVLVTSAFFACFNIPQTWPLPVGLGGVGGDMVLNLPELLLGEISGFYAVILGALFIVPAFWLILAASGLIWKLHEQTELQPDDIANDDDFLDGDGEANWFLGAVSHYFFVFKMRFFKPKPANPVDTGQALEKPGLMHRIKGFHAKIMATGKDDILDDFDRYDMPQQLGGTQTQREPIIEGQVPAPEFQNPEYGENTYNEYKEAEAIEEEWAEQAAPQPAVIPETVSTATPTRVKTQAPPPTPSKRVEREAQPSLISDGEFELPPLSFMQDVPPKTAEMQLSPEALEANARTLEGVLDDFGIKGEIINVHPGPVVTLYELEPAPGIKSARIIGLADDIARSMAAIAARVAVIPGRNAIGIELPNANRETVFIREILASKVYENTKAKLPLILGKTIGGEATVADLAKMPHLLVAGTTGSGKSVAINTIIMSLLYRFTPEQVKMIMIDPKMLELSIYDGIPHLLTPVVTDPKKAVVALKWSVREMEERYKKMSKIGVRNIDGYNTRAKEAKKSGERFTRTIQTGYDRDTGEAIYETEEIEIEPMPYIVVIIDEMADLMMVAGKDIEGTVQRLAQMARAAGIHVIMATQRPSTDVITGTIKANFPTRISFQVTSKIDSRVMLGESGAEQLLGMGDMLYMAGGGRIQRVHGPFVDDGEVDSVVNHLKAQGIPQYLDSVTEEQEEEGAAAGGDAGALSESNDIYDQAVAIVLRDRKVSTSYIQRRLSIGYNRAASLIERMEEEGLISAANHAGKREILVPDENETI
jgi:S-DNA-T family DNA segregation ATPase FtsK/SpoIIIE